MAGRTIWLVNPFDDVPGEGTSPLRYWTLASALASRGHRVTWWSATWSHRLKLVRHVPTGVPERYGFELRLVSVRPYRRNVSAARIASHADFGQHFEDQAGAAVAAGILARPDVILASLPPIDSPEASMRLARRFGSRFILDVQDLWPETFARILPAGEWLRRAVAPVLFGRMYERRERLVAGADCLVAATATYANRVFARAPQETPQHVCYIGADLTAFPDGHEAAAKREHAAVLNCVYAGSLEAGQDIDILPKVARLLSERGIAATLHVAGAGSMQQRLRLAAARVSGPCRVKVHGLLDRERYRSLLSACHVGLVCVKPESFVAVPNKACDYAAAGLALVNSLPGELAGLIDRFQAGVSYRAGCAASLAAAIAELASERRRVTDMQRAARRLAEEMLDRSISYPRFAAWIEAVDSSGRTDVRP